MVLLDHAYTFLHKVDIKFLKLNIKSILELLVIAVIVFTSIFGFGLLKKERYLSYIDPFYNEPVNSLDGVFIGSSAVYRYWLPPVAFHDTGSTIYSYSTIGMPFFAYDNIIKEIRKTQSPVFIAIEIRPLIRKPSSYTTDNAKYITDFMKPGNNRLFLLGDFFKTKFLYFENISINPLRYAFPEDVGHSDSLQLAIAKKARFKGAYPFLYGERKVLKKPEFTSKCKPLSYNYKSELNSFLKEIDSIENCSFVFVATPWDISKENQSKINTAISIITDHGYPVINMNCDSAVTSMNLDYANDFYDTRHVNVQGQIKTTKYLMNKFKNMYNLPDQRNDPLYGSWQHSYDSFISAPINPTVQSKNFVIMKGFK